MHRLVLLHDTVCHEILVGVIFGGFAIFFPTLADYNLANQSRSTTSNVNIHVHTSLVKFNLAVLSCTNPPILHQYFMPYNIYFALDCCTVPYKSHHAQISPESVSGKYYYTQFINGASYKSNCALTTV